MLIRSSTQGTRSRPRRRSFASDDGAARFARAPRALWRRCDDEIIIAIAGEAGFERLVGPAAAMWEMLGGPRTSAELIDELAAVYDVDRANIADDVDKTISTLLQRGSLEAIVADRDPKP